MNGIDHARDAACMRYINAQNRLTLLARQQAAAGCPLAARETRLLALALHRAARAEAMDPVPKGLGRG